MDSESIVYGCIKDVSATLMDAERRAKNRASILSLPSQEGWPYLCQEMFSLPSIEAGPENYQTDVVHFGASYKAIEYEWKGWMGRFEQLLDSMFWVSAIVHLETELSGIHTFVWECEGECHIPGQPNNNIRCEWSREHAII